MTRALVMVLAAGCSFQVASLPGGTDAGFDLSPDLAMSGCDPAGANDRCSDDGAAVLNCRADRTFLQTTCPSACVATPKPHCGHLVPSVPGPVASDFTLPGLTAIHLTGNTTIDADTGAITGALSRSGGSGVKAGIGWRQLTQPTHGSPVPNVSIFSFAGLTVDAGARVTFTGTNAVMLVSSADVTLNGPVDVTGSCSAPAPGPGGFAGGVISNNNGLGGGPTAGSGGGGSGGGGGAGFGDLGGAGGGGGGSTGGSGGLVVDPTGTDQFFGGSGGGAGSTGPRGIGGGGGGALAILVDGLLTLASPINASGCGGAAGDSGDGGGGGGAGGLIVLEAGRVVLAPGTVLAVNGGGGGAGDTLGANGQNGQPGPMAATGGTPGAGGTRGGDGGAHMPSTAGKSGVSANSPCGGGGGAAGRIYVRARPGTGNVKDQGAIWSPDPADVNTSGQKMSIITTAAFN